MKITKYLLLSFALLAFSCSKDDDPEPLEKKTLSLGEGNQVVEIPTGLMMSEDPYAQMVTEWLSMANGLSGHLSYANIPEGAVKSTTKITASNGRTKGSGDVVVYTWSDVNSGYKIAYQVSEITSSYVFEIFMMFPDETEWIKYFHAEEKKDKSSGFMKIYDILGFTDDYSNLLLNYQWSRSGDQFNLSVKEYFTGDYVELSVNLKTKAGSLVYYSQDVKTYEMNWDAKGNGSWKSFDASGNLDEEGNWTV